MPRQLLRIECGGSVKVAVLRAAAPLARVELAALARSKHPALEDYRDEDIAVTFVDERGAPVAGAESEEGLAELQRRGGTLHVVVTHANGTAFPSFTSTTRSILSRTTARSTPRVSTPSPPSDRASLDSFDLAPRPPPTPAPTEPPPRRSPIRRSTELPPRPREDPDPAPAPARFSLESRRPSDASAPEPFPRPTPVPPPRSTRRSTDSRRDDARSVCTDRSIPGERAGRSSLAPLDSVPALQAASVRSTPLSYAVAPRGAAPSAELIAQARKRSASFGTLAAVAALLVPVEEDPAAAAEAPAGAEAAWTVCARAAAGSVSVPVVFLDERKVGPLELMGLLGRPEYAGRRAWGFKQAHLNPLAHAIKYVPRKTSLTKKNRSGALGVVSFTIFFSNEDLYRAAAAKFPAKTADLHPATFAAHFLRALRSVPRSSPPSGTAHSLPRAHTLPRSLPRLSRTVEATQWACVAPPAGWASADGRGEAHVAMVVREAGEGEPGEALRGRVGAWVRDAVVGDWARARVAA